MEAPQWLTEDYIRNFSVPEVGSYTNLKLKSAERAIAKGDNFMSIIYRVQVEYILKNGAAVDKSFIIKSIPDDEAVQPFIEATGAFKREIRLYTEILPKINETLQNSRIPNSKVNATFYYSSNNSVLVFEDLKSLGYVMIDRASLLDYEHCLLVLRTQAKFHAASFAILQKDPSAFNSCEEPLYSVQKIEFVRNITGGLFEPLIATVDEWAGFENISRGLKNIVKNFVELLIEVVKPNPKFPSVFDHGDSWKNNLLFKYNESGKPESLVFVDFQISRFSSPVLDILYFLYSSAQDDILENRIDKLIKEYHKALFSNLELLNCDNVQYSLEDLKQDVKNRLLWALYTSCSLRAAVLIDKDKVIDLSDVVEIHNESDRKGMLMNMMSDAYKKSMRTILLHFEREGLFA